MREGDQDWPSDERTGKAHMKLQKNIAKMTATGEIQRAQIRITSPKFERASVGITSHKF
jgi:hypothetical protein